ncbi:pentapeptide repeat-containing protein [Parabacteroides sp. OttesenSCG-928-G21]|nr:pentapeptide repeat-containing protein [Parabacteroides sp. OttesenSCG-928-G21]
MTKRIKISQEEFETLYNEHQIWLSSSENREHKPDFSNLDFSEIDFTECKNFRYADLYNANMAEVDLVGADLVGANLVSANFSGANLSKANLFESNMSRTILTKGNFWGANMASANISRSLFFQTDLSNALLADSNLSGSLLDDVIFSNAIVVNSNLSNTSFNKANLFKANLSNSNLSGAKLSEADLSEANLTGATLYKANLLNTNLSGTILYGTGVRRIDAENQAKYDNKTTFDSEFDPTEYDKKKYKNLEFEVNRLNSELKNKTDLTEAIKNEYEKKIESIQLELDAKIKKGEEIQANLTQAFSSLEGANSGIEKEIKSHRILYRLFLFGLITLIMVLLFLWCFVISKYSIRTDLKYSDLLLYISPSLILVGFICGCVVEINKIRRHLIGLREITRKFSVIKIALEGYYNVTDKLERNPIKAQESFERIMNEFIEFRVEFDRKEEEVKHRDDKEKFVPEKAAEISLQIAKNALDGLGRYLK